jgi:uncharacterized protein (DUF4415 family)
MQSNRGETGKDDKKFVETAKRIIKQNPEVFEALMEFERTKKLPKLTRKERINVTIDSSLLRKFREYCRKNNKVISRIIEEHIKKELGMKN